MSTYSVKKQRASIPKQVVILLAVFLVLVVAGGLGVQQWYRYNLHPVSSSTTVAHFNVPEGAPLNQIAKEFQTPGLSRRHQAFICHVRSKNARDKPQARTYH